MCMHQPVPNMAPCERCARDEGLMDVDLAYASLQHLTVTRVVNYLTYTFDSGTDEIKVEDTVTTPIGLANDCWPGILASEVPILFWGGPPDEPDWFQGSLLTMLIDRLFYNVATGNNWVVDRFLDAINGNSPKRPVSKASCAGLS